MNAVPAEAEAILSGIRSDMLKNAADKIKDVKFGICDEKNGTVKIKAYGRSAHAAHAGDGINAVSALVKCLALLPGEYVPEAFRKLDRALPFGDTAGKAFGAACRDDISGALSVNLGLISGGSKGFTAQIDCRVPVCGDGDVITEALAEKIPAIKTENVSWIPPHHVPADSAFVKGLLDIYRDYTGRDDEPISIGGLTYVHDVEGGVAFGCVFPGVETHMHEPDERIAFDDLILSGKMFSEAIIKFCG